MEWPLFEGLDADARRAALTQSRRRRFRRGEVVFHEGDPADCLHLIDRGHVAVRRTTPLGDVGTLAVLGPGEMFGELAAVAPAGRNATVVALGAVETLSVPVSVFAALRESNSSVDRMLIAMLTAEVRRLSAALMDALYLPAEKRFFRRLAELVDTFAEGSPPTAPVEVPLTQEELSRLAGVSRPTANRLLKGAEAAGLLVVERGGIRIVDRPGVVRRSR